MQNLVLDGQLNEWTLDSETLASLYGFRSTKSGNVVRVNSAPRKVMFGGKEFVASFIFSENMLKHIVLIPIIEGVDIPNYPSEDYQSLKMKYCSEILNGFLGDSQTILPEGVQWTTDKYTIGCYAVYDGKDKYTGGNITIDMR